MMRGMRSSPGYTPGDTVFIYPTANVLTSSTAAGMTAGTVCSPAYDETTGFLRVRTSSGDSRTCHMILVSPADVCQSVQKRSRAAVARYPLPL